MNPLSDVMGGWGIWETVNGERQLTTECIENVILMMPFTGMVMWMFDVEKGVVWKSTKLGLIFSVSIQRSGGEAFLERMNQYPFKVAEMRGDKDIGMASNDSPIREYQNILDEMIAIYKSIGE